MLVDLYKKHKKKLNIIEFGGGVGQKNLEFNIVRFGKLISKSSNTEVIIVKNHNELSLFLKKNLIKDEIIIGMGAGLISKWMMDLKNFL